MGDTGDLAGTGEIEMKLWSVSWLYPLEVAGLPQWKRKEVLIEADSSELAKAVIEMWAENNGYQTLCIQIWPYGEIDETTGTLTFTNVVHDGSQSPR